MSRTQQIIGLAGIGIASLLPVEAHAAMALCERSHAGEVAEDKSELVAKKRALDSWLAQAAKHGEQYTRWGIPWNRRLDSTRTEAGLFRCQAAGRPCAVRQVPVEGAIRLRRGASD